MKSYICNADTKLKMKNTFQLKQRIFFEAYKGLFVNENQKSQIQFQIYLSEIKSWYYIQVDSNTTTTKNKYERCKL